MKAQDVIDRARVLAADVDAETWDAPTVLNWLNDGRSTAYVLRPDLYSVTEPMTLVAGVDQAMPNDSKRLLDVVRNLSHRNKRAITPVDPDVINRNRPNRRKQTESEEILHFVYDETDPTVFEVYPPAKVGTQVEVRYALPPVPITDLQEELEEEGALAHGLVDFVLARCYQLEIDANAGQAAKADRHMAQFQALFSGDATAQAAASPNATREGSVKTQ